MYLNFPLSFEITIPKFPVEYLYSDEFSNKNYFYKNWTQENFGDLIAIAL